MRFIRTWLAISATLFAAGTATAQNTNGTISGHVTDSQGLALPGVTINVTSPNLQGTRTATSSTNGDYIFSSLPSGTYTVTFDLSGFQQQQKIITTCSATSATSTRRSSTPAPGASRISSASRTTSR